MSRRIIADLSALDRAYRAKRSGMCRVEYSASIFHYSRPTSWKSWAMTAAAALILLAAVAVGVAK